MNIYLIFSPLTKLKDVALLLFLTYKKYIELDQFDLAPIIHFALTCKKIVHNNKKKILTFKMVKLFTLFLISYHYLFKMAASNTNKILMLLLFIQNFLFLFFFTENNYILIRTMQFYPPKKNEKNQHVKDLCHCNILYQ